MRRVVRLVLAGLARVLTSETAVASSVLEVPDNGSEAMARGGAWIARATDPLATTFNPAGLAGQATRLTLQTNIVVQHTCFARLRAATDGSVDPLVSASGRFPRVCNDIEPEPNPQLAATFRIDDRLALGISVGGPAAAGSKTWPEFVEDGDGKRRASPQRYLLTRQTSLVLVPTIGVGYQVLPELRIGASFGWGIAHIKSAAATVALANGFQTSDNDIRAKVQVADAFVPRASLGAIWRLSSRVDLAGWYQWTDAIRATGDLGTASSYYTAANARGDASRVGYADTIFSDCGTGRLQDAGKCGDGDNAKLTLPLPMEAKLGLRLHQPREGAPRSAVRDPLATERWDAEVDLTWANNSAIDAIEVRFPGDASGAGRLPVSGINAEIPPNADQVRRYRDVLGIRAGGDLVVVPDVLAVRGGAFYETSANREPYQHIELPATARFGVALGLTTRIRLGERALELMGGYGHTFFADAVREDANASGIGATAGTSCAGTAVPASRTTCSDGSERFRTRWPVNLGTIKNALNVIHVGVAYRF